ncbi:MAG: serine protease, partial [Gemmatimonadota bacterium]|nr:serine protease [Gemmatimonadota bacterium]
SVAGRRVVETAEPAVVFLQGEYGWIAPDGRPLRLVTGPDGTPRRSARGLPLTSLEGTGPPFAAQFTGSAFLVREDGLLVTNRHVARPWTADEHAADLFAKGFRPRLRLLAYAPGANAPVGVRFVAQSRDSDLALIRAEGVADGVRPIPLAEETPRAGDEVVVLGYPAGIGALLARSGPAFLDSARTAHLDFWNVVEELAAAELIRPLASRGIVGQVTPASIVYDAETTQGGSGGPVLSLSGELVAVTFGILPEFGGSNFGVPVEEVRRLLATVPPLPADEPAAATAGEERN